MDHIFHQYIALFGYIPNEFVTFLEFLILSTILLMLFRKFSYIGIYIFNVVAVIIGNLQVLREVSYGFQTEKIALGSIIFAMTFIGSDIITEHYGKNLAKNGVLLTFYAQMMFIISMLICMVYTPHNDIYFDSLKRIFITSPRLFIASLIAYLCSQMLDISLFSFLKTKLRGLSWLWIRSILSLLLASLVDNIIFSTLAWKIFADQDISLKKLIFTYILGTYWFKTFVNLCTVPIIYLSYKIKK